MINLILFLFVSPTFRRDLVLILIIGIYNVSLGMDTEKMCHAGMAQKNP